VGVRPHELRGAVEGRFGGGERGPKRVLGGEPVGKSFRHEEGVAGTLIAEPPEDAPAARHRK
jgi:hypothetical protein